MELHEKISLYGFNAISNFEVLNTFIPQLKAATLHSEFGGKFSSLMRATTKDLVKLGLTTKEAHRVLAIGQVHARMIQETDTRMKLSSSKDAFVLFSFLKMLNVEEFHALYIDRSNKMLCRKQISIGGISSCVVDVKVILKHAIECGASSIIVCHNHPSGNLEPSAADKKITTTIKEAAKIMDINLIDHIIIGGSQHDSYYSFADEGCMI
jgi:DNA repair protein RadC